MKSTKRSLFASVLALVLCVCMLLGTTWAWFTDEVQSGVNQIVAGNLDVELYNANGKVESDTMLFDVDLWEPGMVVYENFTVKNVGNLALKYQLGMTTGDFNTVDGYSLKDVLKATIVPDGFSGDRDAAQALSGYTDLNSFSVSGNGSLLPDESQSFAVVIYWEPGDNDNDYNLNNGKEATPSNKFGKDALGIELGVKLLATQLEYEKDSFDEHYDGSAELNGEYNQSVEPVSSTVSATVKEGEATVFTAAATPSNEKGNTTKVTVPAEVKEFAEASGQTSSMTVEATPIVAANNKFTVSTKEGAVGAIDLTVKVNDAVVSEFKDASGNAIPVTVETYVAKGLTGVELKYNGEGPQPTDVTYDKVSGKLSWKTVHFSTFVLGANEVAYVESNNTAYLTLAEAMQNISSGDTLTILKNFNLTSQTTSGLSAAKCTIDLNGKTITASGTWKLSNTVKEYMSYEDYLDLGWSSPSKEEYEADPYLLGMKENPVDVTIKNGTYIINGTDSGRIRFEHGSTGVFEDMTIKSSNGKWYQALQTYATDKTGTEVNKYSFKKCTFENCFTGFEGKSGSCNEYQISFDKCGFTAANMSNGAACIKVEAYGYGTMNISNTTFDINNTNNGGYCVYPDSLRSYTNGQKMSVSLNNVTMNTKGNANPYTYDYDYNSADGSRDWSAEVICNGTNNVFIHNGKTVQMFIKETSATNKSIAWTENVDAYKACLAEWVAYASASPACADYNSMNYYLVECNGYYYIGGQGQQFNDNATVTKDGDTVTQVVVSGYFSTTYKKVGTTDISTQLGDADNTAVHIYTLATK